MDILLTIAALGLPILLGGLWLNLLVPSNTTARSAIVWGYGTLLGLLLIPQFLWALDALEIPLSFWGPASLTGGLIVLAVFAGSLRHRSTHSEIQVFHSIPASHKSLIILLLLLLVLRLSSLGLEVLWRPLFPWDATMHWATKARVWFEFRSMVPFVENAAWLNLGGEGVFTDRHPNYPPTIPLLQVWMSLAVERWDESLMNLPWLLCLAALGSAVYGQLRFSGIRPAISMGFTYLLLSMPLINTHVALAGYADLFLGAAYCGALMAFHNWVSTRQPWQAVLMLLFVIACPLIKNEGYLWALTLVPAVIIAFATRRQAAWLTALTLTAMALLAVLLLYGPFHIDFVMRHITGFDMKALLGIIKSVWLHNNWHLFGYLLPVIIMLGLLLPPAVSSRFRGLAAALASAVALFLFLFLFTVFSEGASNFTGVGRLSIQLVPALLFLSALLSNEILTRGRVRAAPAVNATQ